MIFISSAVAETQMPRGQRRYMWLWFLILAIVYVYFGIGLRSDEVRQSEQDRQELKTVRDNSTKLIGLVGLIPPLAQDVSEMKRQLATNRGANIDPQLVKDLDSKTGALQKALTAPEMAAIVKSIQAGQSIAPPIPIPSRGANLPPQSCQEVEVHVQLSANLNINQPSKYFDFPDQEVGTTSRPTILGVSCLTPSALAKVQFTLQGPFYFGDGKSQEYSGPVTPSTFHLSIVFRPNKVGPVSGTLTISSPNVAKITPFHFENPATLHGVGKN